MSEPVGFSWIEKPRLAALAWPDSLSDLHWLRAQGIDVLLSLTEEPPRRDWTDAAGILVFHVPVEDMEAPTQEQLDRCISALRRAHEKSLGVAVHCGAGLGRTGSILATWFVADQGLTGTEAVARVRRLRPGSIETPEQVQAVETFARRLARH
jgi:atypical dual specificity phosphatase